MNMGYFLEAMHEQALIEQILAKNPYAERYGLTLSREDAGLLAVERGRILRQERRVEVGQGIMPQIIEVFCDSAYISQDNYVDSLVRLEEIFFAYKNETMDELTDGELLSFMKEQFETVCGGDMEYLEGTCLELFAQAVRAGYQGHQATQGRGGFGELDIVTRWDRALYLEALEQLF
mgnify:CR=1 FL=1